MSANIGTNFNYESKKYLDNRQNLPKTKEDLKNWNTLVPEGFEVYVDGFWYVYKSYYIDEETGHWERRIDSDIPGTFTEQRIQTNSNDIRGLEESVYPVTIKLTSPKYVEFEDGTTFPANTEIISFDIMHKGEKIKPTSVKINNNIKVPDDQLSSSISVAIPYNMSANIFYFNIEVKAYDGKLVQTAYERVDYYGGYKVYAGTSDKDSITDDEILNLTYSNLYTTRHSINSSDFILNYKMDCTGGKYVYVAIPDYSISYKEEEFRVFVNDIELSDFTIEERSVHYFPSNKYLRKTYFIIRLNNKQTGILNVAVKYKKSEP